MKNMLDHIQADKDLKQLSSAELKELCNDIRDFLIKSVSKTGGHLASNLGAVELTVAVHRVFDLPEDKLIFDVGHQSYVHKLLTGRKDKFDTLRQFGGISGFPKRSESEFDAFDTGHSSTSVSAALGMARARDLNDEKYNIIAIFGDGALTGGEIYEALNDAGRSKTPLILILNDNNMSISKNVGAISKHLRNIRISRYYFKSKRRISGFLRRVPLAGTPLRSVIEGVKSLIRKFVLPTTFFEDMGFKYIGPMNGHDIDTLIDCLEYAKSEKKPVIIHACTTKGMGYSPAYKDPSAFHGVGKFDPQTGELLTADGSYSDQFSDTVVRLAKRNPKVCAITCAMPDGTGLYEFSKQFRNRFFDVGIAEEHGVTLAAGMAAAGMIPVIPLYSTFLQRGFDQALHDVCLQSLHVIFPVDRAGAVGADGETHQGVYDISFLSCMPNMTILSPSSFAQLDEMLTYAVEEHNGPIAIRYPRGGTQSPYPAERFEINRAYIKRKGTHVSVITSGRMTASAGEIAQKLEKQNISAEIVELPTIYPINVSAVIAAAMKTGFVITLEDNVKSGGLGEHIASTLLENGIYYRFKSFGFPSEPIVHGTVSELDRKYGIDADTIVKYIKKSLS